MVSEGNAVAAGLLSLHVDHPQTSLTNDGYQFQEIDVRIPKTNDPPILKVSPP